MTTEHLTNTIKYLEDKFAIPRRHSNKPKPAPGEPITMKLLPSPELVSQYKEMERVLAERIMDEFREKVETEKKKTFINPFEFI
jgi:hypothetical protein